MKKQTIDLKIDSIHMHAYLSRVLQHCTQPDFIDKAFLEFGVFDNPCVFYNGGKYYLLNNNHFFNLAVQQGCEVITVTLLEIEEEDLIKALIVLNFHANKQPRAMAELVKIIIEYRTTDKGAEWIKECTQSDNKEIQVALLLGISRHIAKCYIKITNDEYSDLLNKLDIEYEPTKAYEAACKRDTERRNGTKEENEPSDNYPIEPLKPSEEVEGSHDDIEDEDDELPTIKPEPNEPSGIKKSNRAKPPTAIYLGENIEVDPDPNVYGGHLEDYKTPKGSPKQQPLFPGGVEIRVFNGAKLEFDGEVELSIDKQPVISESQLQKIGSNRYLLPKVFDEVTLIVRFKREDLGDCNDDDFFDDL